MEYRIQKSIRGLPDIREITKTHKVNIKFSKDPKNDTVEIAGLTDNIQSAKKEFDKLLQAEVGFILHKMLCKKALRIT